jgi:hypothetical protein
MKKLNCLAIALFSNLILILPVFSCEVDISDYVGWEIIYSGTVTGYIDKDNSKEKDSFEGCEYGRVLIVDYNKQITCAEYSYSYSYRPDIVVLSNGYSMEACINDKMYDVRK